ncbi:SusC/RagA family TonB-linked outer membrane protein, partial [Bacteroides thetaiotaomicron]
MKNILFTSNKVHTTARIGVLFFSLCFSPLINAGNAEKPMNGIESSETTQQNKIKITGVVTDSKGESIIGANVVVKGQSNVGAITDVEGRYQIMVPSDNAILQVSYLGYVTEEINVKGRRNINVMLNEDSKALDEVVVVGYGQQKKESVVVSMSSIKPKDIVVPSRSLNNSLAGQVAGLIAVQRSGEPGYDNAEFWIRGVSTFAGGTS